MTEQESTGLEFLSDDELRTHTRIMIEGTGHRGPLSWTMDNLDDDIYREFERRVPRLARLREEMDTILEADLARRQAVDPATADVPEYSDNGQDWEDKAAERAWDRLNEQWRAGLVGWLESGHDDA